MVEAAIWHHRRLNDGVLVYANWKRLPKLFFSGMDGYPFCFRPPFPYYFSFVQHEIPPPIYFPVEFQFADCPSGCDTLPAFWPISFLNCGGCGCGEHGQAIESCGYIEAFNRVRLLKLEGWRMTCFG